MSVFKAVQKLSPGKQFAIIGEDKYENIDWRDSGKPPTKAQVDSILPEVLEEESLNQIRIKRNQFLKNSDWTQLLDSPVDKTAWATYRQELRDFPGTVDLENIIWPEQPDGSL